MAGCEEVSSSDGRSPSSGWRGQPVALASSAYVSAWRWVRRASLAVCALGLLLLLARRGGLCRVCVGDLVVLSFWVVAGAALCRRGGTEHVCVWAAASGGGADRVGLAVVGLPAVMC